MNAFSNIIVDGVRQISSVLEKPNANKCDVGEQQILNLPENAVELGTPPIALAVLKINVDGAQQMLSMLVN